MELQDTYMHIHTNTHPTTEQRPEQPSSEYISEQSLFNLHLVLGMELSLQLFDASSVSQGTGYTFFQRSCVMNSCDFFNAIFLLLLSLGKPEPSIKYLQQEQ